MVQGLGVGDCLSNIISGGIVEDTEGHAHRDRFRRAGREGGREGGRRDERKGESGKERERERQS